jgi:hypothetical protein
MQVTQSVRLSRKEYIELSGESRQNVTNKIRRGTLRLVKTREPVEIEKIELSPEEYATLLNRKQVD